jgi:hypothetical protein
VVVGVGAAWAGDPIIVTPYLATATGQCSVVNASATKPIEVTIQIKDTNGNDRLANRYPPVPPLGVVSLAQTNSAYCVVTVHKGSKKNARVGWMILDQSGNFAAAVSGQ